MLERDRSLKEVLFLFALVVLACSSSRTTKKPDAERKNTIEYLHGSKILTQPLPQKNETHFYQSEIRLEPETTIGAKKVTGHSFEFHHMAFYSNNTPPPKVVTMTITHGITTRSQWRMPLNAKLLFDTDAGIVEAPKGLQRELSKDLPEDEEFYDVIIVDMPFDKFASVARASRVTVQIGSARFNLPSETILAFKDYAEIISRKN